MKKVTSAIIILVFIFSLVSCDKSGKINKSGDSVPGTDSLSNKLFTSVMEKNGYTVTDYTDSFNTYYDDDGNEVQNTELKYYLIANNDETSATISFEFMIFDTVTTAASSYASIVSTYDKEVKDVNKIVDYSTEKYSKCVFKEEKYRSVTRIKNTVLMAATTLGNADEVQKVLAVLGY